MNRPTNAEIFLKSNETIIVEPIIEEKHDFKPCEITVNDEQTRIIYQCKKCGIKKENGTHM